MGNRSYTRTKKSQKRPAPFEIFAKDVKIKYMTLQMPENHNSIVFGAVTRVPQDLILNIKFNMISSDEFSGSEHIGLKEAAREMKIFIVPLTESYLKKAESVSELEIGIELVKRRWQENIQIISVVRENKKIKRSGSSCLMRISLVRILLLRFFKTITKNLPNAVFMYY